MFSQNKSRRIDITYMPSDTISSPSGSSEEGTGDATSPLDPTSPRSFPELKLQRSSTDPKSPTSPSDSEETGFLAERKTPQAASTSTIHERDEKTTYERRDKITVAEGMMGWDRVKDKVSKPVLNATGALSSASRVTFAIYNMMSFFIEYFGSKEQNETDTMFYLKLVTSLGGALALGIMTLKGVQHYDYHQLKLEVKELEKRGRELHDRAIEVFEPYEQINQEIEDKLKEFKQSEKDAKKILKLNKGLSSSQTQMAIETDLTSSRRRTDDAKSPEEDTTTDFPAENYSALFNMFRTGATVISCAIDLASMYSFIQVMKRVAGHNPVLEPCMWAIGGAGIALSNAYGFYDMGAGIGRYNHLKDNIRVNEQKLKDQSSFITSLEQKDRQEYTSLLAELTDSLTELRDEIEKRTEASPIRDNKLVREKKHVAIDEQGHEIQEVREPFLKMETVFKLKSYLLYLIQVLGVIPAPFSTLGAMNSMAGLIKKNDLRVLIACLAAGLPLAYASYKLTKRGMEMGPLRFNALSLHMDQLEIYEKYIKKIQKKASKLEAKKDGLEELKNTTASLIHSLSFQARQLRKTSDRVTPFLLTGSQDNSEEKLPGERWRARDEDDRSSPPPLVGSYGEDEPEKRKNNDDQQIELATFFPTRTRGI